jgi:hypothetical protein
MRPNIGVESESRKVFPKEKLVESLIRNGYPTVKRNDIVDRMIQVSRI